MLYCAETLFEMGLDDVAGWRGFPAHLQRSRKKWLQTTRERTLAAPITEPRSRSWTRKAFGPDWAVALPFILPLLILLAGLIAFPFFDAIRLSFTTRQLTDATH